MAAEPGHDHAGDKAQHDVEHDAGDVVAHARSGVFFVILAQGAVDEVTHHAAEEHHEGVQHALNQRQGHHVAVGNVRNFMAQHRFDLFARHALQQASGHRHQGRVPKSARGKGIGLAFVNGHLGHGDAGLFRQAAHRVHNPGLVLVLRRGDDLRARAPLGHGLAHQQRDDGAAKAHDEREAQQGRQIQAIGREKTIHAQQAGHHAQHHHDSQVGQNEEKNAFHGFL